jgi:hypothetical protein
MILSQNDACIVFLLGFARAMQYPSKFQKICYGAQRIYGYFKSDNACEFSSFRHAQYLFDNLNQNN